MTKKPNFSKDDYKMIESLIARGLRTNKQLGERFDVDESTFRGWLKTDKELKKAVLKGKYELGFDALKELIKTAKTSLNEKNRIEACKLLLEQERRNFELLESYDKLESIVIHYANSAKAKDDDYLEELEEEVRKTTL